MKKNLIFAIIMAILVMGNCVFANTPPAPAWNDSLPAPTTIVAPSNMDIGNPPGLNISNRGNEEDQKTKPWNGAPVRFAPYPGSGSYEEIFEGF